ncbi:MAG: hypothetical protein ABI690_03605 [Chloroflexota bacterium]
MAAQAQVSMNGSTSLAQRALQGDGIFCIVSGAIFTLDAGAISEWVGVKPTEIVLFFGLFLFIYGLALYGLAGRKPLDSRLPITIIAINAVSAVVCLGLLITNPFGFTIAGKWVTLILADVVVGLGIWQYVGLRRMR